MSRTDAHRPPLVWINDHPDLVREVHDHRDGVCSLPPSGPYAPEDLGWSRGRCHVQLDWRVRLCACALCSGGPFRAAARRAARAQTRALLRAAVRGAPAEDIELAEARVAQRARSGW